MNTYAVASDGGPGFEVIVTEPNGSRYIYGGFPTKADAQAWADNLRNRVMNAAQTHAADRPD
jgi:hypothetical protein